MNGREHLFWSLSSYSISIFAYTVIVDARDLNWKWYAMLFALVFVSLALNDIGNFIKSHNKKINKNRAKDVDPIPLKKVERYAKVSLHAWAYFFLLWTMIYSGIVSMPIADSSLFILIGYIAAIFGGTFPDFDGIILGAGGHRNPFTHSGMLTLPIAVIAILICPVQYLPLMIFFSSLLLGTAAHVLCDQFKSNETLADAFAGFFKFKTSPGNIRLIRSDRERHWLFFHAAWLLLFFILGWMRLGEYGFMNYAPVWDGSSVLFSTVAWSIMILMLVYYFLSFTFLIAWRGRKKKKKR